MAACAQQTVHKSILEDLFHVCTFASAFVWMEARSKIPRAIKQICFELRGSSWSSECQAVITLAIYRHTEA